MLSMRKFLLSSGFARLFLYLWGILKRLTKNKKMSIFSKLSNLIVGTVDFKNDDLEKAVENFSTAIGAVQFASLEVDKLSSEENPDYASQASALVDLANTLGMALPDLDADATAQVKATLAAIIKAPTPEQESALENLFNATVDAVVAIQDLNDIADLDAVPPAE
jgi:hypothetical protein